MKCRDLANRIEKIQPDAGPRDVARMCLLLSNAMADVADLENDEAFSGAWKDIGLRLQAATDQHAAMTEELETLADSPPEDFSTDQVWVLIRAIKVQSQILDLYVGEAVEEV